MIAEAREFLPPEERPATVEVEARERRRRHIRLARALLPELAVKVDRGPMLPAWQAWLLAAWIAAVAARFAWFVVSAWRQA